MNSGNRILGGILGFAIFCIGSNGVAAVIAWDGPLAGGKWEAGTNWSPGDVVPAPIDTAFITNGAVVDFDVVSGSVSVASVSLGASNGTQTGEIHVAGGHLAVDTYSNNSGTLRVSSGMLELTNPGNARFAHRNGSQDSIVVSGDGVFTSTARLFGENGSFTVDLSDDARANFLGTHFDPSVRADNGDADPDLAIVRIADNAELHVQTQYGWRFGEGRDGTDVITQTGGRVILSSDPVVVPLPAHSSNGRLILANLATATSSYTMSGGLLDIAGIMDLGAGDALFHVVGSNPVINIGDDLIVRNNSEIRFTLDAAGLSPINIADRLILLAGSDLQVDLRYQATVPTEIAGVVTLFDYGLLPGGNTFGSEMIIDKFGALTAGADPLGDPNNLALGEYFLDYTGAGGTVQLYFHATTVPEPGTMTLLAVAGLAGIFIWRRRTRSYLQAQPI